MINPSDPTMVSDYNYLLSRIESLEETVCKLAELLNAQANQLLRLIGIVENVVVVDKKIDPSAGSCFTNQDENLMLKSDDFFRFSTEGR